MLAVAGDSSKHHTEFEVTACIDSCLMRMITAGIHDSDLIVRREFNIAFRLVTFHAVKSICV